MKIRSAFLATLSAICMTAVVASPGCGLSSAINELSSPAATQAAQNVQVLVNAVECFVAATDGALNAGLAAGNAKGQTATKIIYVTSQGLCLNTYKGTPGASVTVPAAAVVSN